jgi:trans-2,3-dihydro-3-hydroxyanthranilate isomerase
MLQFVWMTQSLPEMGTAEDPAAVAQAIGVPQRAIVSTGLPVQRVSCGVPFVIVPMATRADVDAALPDARLLSALAASAGYEHFSLYLFTTDRAGAKDEAMVYTRMFAPGLGIYEDPATGSASGPLGCYLVAHGVVPRGRENAILNLQGNKMGRPSRLLISIDSDGEAITRVRVGGGAVFVAEGSFEV